MFAIFNRFDPRFEEAARDLGASPWQALRHVVLPIIGPSLIGIGLFGFTLSWDEIARTSQAVGYLNTLPGAAGPNHHRDDACHLCPGNADNRHFLARDRRSAGCHSPATSAAGAPRLGCLPGAYLS